MDATWMITTFVLIDTAMTNLDHQTDVRAGVPDSDIAMGIWVHLSIWFTQNYCFTSNIAPCSAIGTHHRMLSIHPTFRATQMHVTTTVAAANSPQVGCSPSMGQAQIIVKKGWMSCTWLTRCTPPVAKP